MAQRMREFDWTRSPLGSPELWPASLRTSVNLMLGSAFPMFIAWGTQWAQLYNDAYAEIMGDKHPEGLGRPILENWSEIRDDIEPLIKRALAGDSYYRENLPLRMHRRDFLEDAWFTFSYSPLQGDDGQVGGMFCACIETVSASSRGPGKGSRFEVRLPLAETVLVPPPAAHCVAPSVNGLPSRCVLLADDNRDAADTLAELLRMDGHTVHTAHDGLDAIDKAMALRPDVLVLDIGMPGLNGYEVARRLRGERWGHRPYLIAATGWGRDNDRQTASEAGFDAHLTKPFDPLRLAMLVGQQGQA